MNIEGEFLAPFYFLNAIILRLRNEDAKRWYRDRRANEASMAGENYWL